MADEVPLQIDEGYLGNKQVHTTWWYARHYTTTSNYESMRVFLSMYVDLEFLELYTYYVVRYSGGGQLRYQSVGYRRWPQPGEMTFSIDVVSYLVYMDGHTCIYLTMQVRASPCLRYGHGS